MSAIHLPFICPARGVANWLVFRAWPPPRTAAGCGGRHLTAARGRDPGNVATDSDRGTYRHSGNIAEHARQFSGPFWRLMRRICSKCLRPKRSGRTTCVVGW